jgi:hypothetical protein
MVANRGNEALDDAPEPEFDSKLWERVMKHPGKVVVVDDPLDPDSKIVIAATSQAAMNKAARLGIERPVFIHVPEEGAIFLL